MVKILQQEPFLLNTCPITPLKTIEKYLWQTSFLVKLQMFELHFFESFLHELQDSYSTLEKSFMQSSYFSHFFQSLIRWKRKPRHSQLKLAIPFCRTISCLWNHEIYRKFPGNNGDSNYDGKLMVLLMFQHLSMMRILIPSFFTSCLEKWISDLRYWYPNKWTLVN